MLSILRRYGRWLPAAQSSAPRARRRTLILRPGVEPLERRLLLSASAGADDPPELNVVEAAPAAAADDHGNDADGATLVATNSVTAGDLEESGDVDWFRFSANSGDSFHFEVSLKSLDDSLLRLIDVDGLTELEKDDDGGLDFASRIADWTAPTDGLYFLEVSGFGDTGSYDLSVDVTPEDHGNDSASATEVAVGSVTDGAIEVNSDVDVFSFQASSGQVFIFKTSLISLGSSRLRLLDVDGTSEIPTDDVAAGPSSRIEWQAPVGGTYFLEVGGLGTGSYRLSVTRVIDDHGDSAGNARPIDVDAEIAGIIEIGDDVDWFRFQTVAGQLYVVRGESDSIVGFQVQLVDRNGVTHINPEGGCNSMSRTIWTAPRSGFYFIKVSGAVGQYGLSVSAEADDHGDVPSDATAVNVDSTTDGSVNFGCDVDWFRFSAEQDKTYLLTTELSTLDNTVLRLINPEGTTGIEEDDEDGPSRIQWKAPESGDFFLEVSAFRDSRGDYQLTVTVIDDDHGDEAGAATLVETGSLTAGNIEFNGDVDWLSFQAIASDDYLIEADPVSLLAATLSLFDTDGTSLLATHTSLAEQNARIGFRATFTGLHFVEVFSAAPGDVGSYELTIEPVPDDHSDAFAGATPVAIDDTGVPGVIVNDSDVDWLGFSAQEGRDYLIEVDPITLPRATLSLLGVSGATQLATTTGSFGESPVLAFRAAQRGDHFIEVRGVAQGDVGSYELAIASVPDDHADNFSSATAIEVDDPFVSGVIGSGSDVDWFAFGAEAGQEYLIETSLDSLGRGRLELFDADGSSPALKTDEGAGFINWPGPQTGGTFLIRVSGFAESDFGGYRLNVRVEGDDHGDDRLTATPVTSDSTTSGEIATGDVDWFSFEALQGNRFDFEIRLDSLPDSVLRLIDVDGETELAFNDDAPGQDTASRIADWTAPTDGRFFLEVSGFDAFSDTGSYFLDVINKSEPSRVGDLTGNGFVDFEDLTVLLANWNQNVSAAKGNLVDVAGTPVNFEDLTVLLAAWTGPGGAAAPQAAEATVSGVASVSTRDTAAAESHIASDDHFDRLGRRDRVIARRAKRTNGLSSHESPLRRLQAVAIDRAMTEESTRDQERIIRRRAANGARR